MKKETSLKAFSHKKASQTFIVRVCQPGKLGGSGKIPKSGFLLLTGLEVHLEDMSHLSTAVAWREKISKYFVYNKYFFLVLGVLKSEISKKYFKGLSRKLYIKLFHYKARV